MVKVKLGLHAVRKEFSRRIIFDNLTLSLTNGDSIAITGKNGSGKSTLVKIVAGIVSPTRGSLAIEVNDTVLKRETYHNHIGFVAPYLNLYDEFSAEENLRHAERIRGIRLPAGYRDELLKRVSLYHRRSDPVRTYSSGMKQRLKYAFALLHKPSVLIFDEPRANLDREGIETIYSVMQEHKANGGLLMLATNDPEDIPYAATTMNLDDRRTGTAAGRNESMPE